MSELTIPFHTEDHVRGNPDAPYVLVEYGDYQCPDTREAHDELITLLDEMPDRLCLVFRNMPLDKLYPIHPQASQAALAAEAAGCQGKFWEMHDAIFANQADLSEDRLVELAESLGLSIEQFEEDFASSEVEELVERDFTSGQDSGVTETPAFFLNGDKIEDSRDIAQLAERLRGL